MRADPVATAVPLVACCAVDLRRLARSYWSVGVLAAFALVLLLMVDIGDEALAAAGFAFAGAAVTRLVDIASKNRDDKAREIQRRREDLDETRRLAYIALAAAPQGALRQHGSPELVATLVNAFAHHGLGVDPKEATDHVVAILSGVGVADGAAWLQGRITEINAEIERLDRVNK